MEAWSLPKKLWRLSKPLVLATRQQRESELQEAVISQLTKLFGHVASAPVDFYIKDWAFDPYTATESDLEGLSYHPTNYLSTVIEPLKGP